MQLVADDESAGFAWHGVLAVWRSSVGYADLRIAPTGVWFSGYTTSQTKDGSRPGSAIGVTRAG